MEVLRILDATLNSAHEAFSGAEMVGSGLHITQDSKNKEETSAFAPLLFDSVSE